MLCGRRFQLLSADKINLLSSAVFDERRVAGPAARRLLVYPGQQRRERPYWNNQENVTELWLQVLTSLHFGMRNSGKTFLSQKIFSYCYFWYYYFLFFILFLITLLCFNLDKILSKFLWKNEAHKIEKSVFSNWRRFRCFNFTDFNQHTLNGYSNVSQFGSSAHSIHHIFHD